MKRSEHIAQQYFYNKEYEKALKIFKTQKEAIDYAKGVAKNQEGSIRVHSKAGKLRKAK